MLGRTLRVLAVVGGITLFGAVACRGSAAALTPTPVASSASATPLPSTPSAVAVSTPNAASTSATPGAPVSSSTPTSMPPSTGNATVSPSAGAGTDRFQLTSQDRGQTFTYPLTSRFGIVLDGQKYPRADLQVSCDQNMVLGPISNLPSVSPPDYAVRYEGVNPGTCTISDRDFSVTIVITAPPPLASTPVAATPTPSSAETPPGTEIGGTPPYLDDRSSGPDVVRSYYNAIDRHEYDRAYSYWEPSAASRSLPPYAQFKAGYADTDSVQLGIGNVWGQGAAGNIYESVAVTLTSQLKNGGTAVYVGCYNLHLGQPSIQDQPPFDPWAIQSATIQPLAAGADPSAQLASVCDQNGAAPGTLVPTPESFPTGDISKDRYLDDRSTPEEVLRSLFNAIDRHEYDRAYSYWDLRAPNTGLPSYDQFKAGYANTASVDLTLGKTTAGVAAGNLYFRVPVTLVAQTTAGQSQTFVGCYTLHLSQPAIQDLPPYQPMAIQSANVKQLTNGSDAAAQMAIACPRS